MWFLEKREILEYCGKNGKDVRRLDRAMRKWIVIHDEDRGYITTVDYIDELREGLKELNKSEPKEELNRVSSLEEELYEAKAQWEYYQKLYEAEKEDKQNRIRKCFRRIKNIKPSADWEEFRDWVMDDNE